MILRASDKFATGEDDAPRSQTTLAYEAIRSDILQGHFVPEKKLKIQELAVDLNVSPGAVREALSRLVPEQLVLFREQRGFVVAPLSVADLMDLTDLRCEIEAIALRRSIMAANEDWEANLLAAEYRLRSHRPGGTSDETKRKWREKHFAFHTTLVSQCGNRRLLTLHALLYEQSERYRGLMFHVESRRDIVMEHQQIVDLALARNIDQLIEMTLAHFRKTTEMILEAFVSNEHGLS